LSNWYRIRKQKKAGNKIKLKKKSKVIQLNLFSSVGTDSTKFLKERYMQRTPFLSFHLY